MAAVAYVRNTPPMGCGEEVVNLIKGEKGIYITQKLAHECVELIVESARLRGSSLEHWKPIAEVLKNGAAGITIPYAVSSTIEACQAMGEVSLKIENGESFFEEALACLQKIATSVQMTALSVFLFTEKAACEAVSSVFGAVDDVLDVVISGKDLKGLTERQIENLTKEAKIYVEESKNLVCIKLAKAVFSATVGVLEVLALAWGVTVAPVITILSLSVMSSALEIFDRCYEMHMTYQAIL